MDGRRAGGNAGTDGLPGGGFGLAGTTTAPGRFTAVKGSFKAAFRFRRPFRQYDSTDYKAATWLSFYCAFYGCHS